jgi:DNA-binding transcriptional MerR regulator
MDKSPDAFRTISEVAEVLETPAHVLRFWESRFPQIRPVKRAGGRRYYRPADVALLGGIKHLLHDEGLTIRGVQKILREHGIRHVASLAGGSEEIDDADEVEAALAREFALSEAEVIAPAEAETAQIIALETALTRSERVADRPAPVQADLWQDIPDAVAEPAIAETDAVEDAAFVAVDHAADDGREVADEVADGDASGEPYADVDVEILSQSGVAADHPDPHHSPEGPISDDVLITAEGTWSDDADHPTQAPDVLADTPADLESDLPADPDLETEVAETPMETPFVESDSEAAAPAVTSAAGRLRLLPTGSLTHRQAELIVLRDRLRDLRERVAAVSRRRAR